MTTLISTQKKKIKVVTLKTNLNHKLNNKFFCHIQIAGKNGIPESVAAETIFKFITADDNDCIVDAELQDSIRVQLQNISSVFTLLSHAMDRDEFIYKVLKEVPNTSFETEMVIYFYKNLTIQD